MSLAVAPGDDANVVLGFDEGRYAILFINCAFTWVETCERERNVSVELLQEIAQVLCSRFDIGSRIIRVLAAEVFGRRRH